MEEKKPIAYLGFVIDRGIPFDGIQKAVDFFDGVGVLDYEALALIAPYWFDRNATGQIVAVHDNAVSMQAFIDYWEGMGAKVTMVSEMEAREIRTALGKGGRIDSKYLKAVVDTRKVAGGAGESKDKPWNGPPTFRDQDIIIDTEPAPVTKKKGVK